MEILENYTAWRTTFHQGWLAHVEETGKIDWDLYNRPRNSEGPAGPGIDLAASRLMFITTSGAYLPGEQAPFDAANPLGDYTIRTIPVSTPSAAMAYAHEHYDRAAVEQDDQVLIPLGHLKEMVTEGAIGELAPSMVSFMGYQPDVSRVVDEMIPAILEVARAEGAQAALLVPA
mgnify:CR=1 FL=1